MGIWVDICLREITDVFKSVPYNNISNITKYIYLLASSALSITNGSLDSLHEFLNVHLKIFLEKKSAAVLELRVSPTFGTEQQDTPDESKKLQVIYTRRNKEQLFLFHRYKIHTEVFPEQEAIMRKHFGSSPPPVTEADRKMSLLIINTNSVFNYPIPLMPSVVPIHSLHVKTTPDPLPNVSNRISSTSFTPYTTCL
jgi:hypothetical protein